MLLFSANMKVNDKIRLRISADVTDGITGFEFCDVFCIVYTMKINTKRLKHLKELKHLRMYQLCFGYTTYFLVGWVA
jgi:hypothetical protein